MSSEATYYGDLASPQVGVELRERMLVLPLGSIEQHGPHLPLTVDLDIAVAIARELAQRENGLLAPAITYGARSLPHCGGGYAFPGTIFARGSVLTAYLADVLTAYVTAAARWIVVVNGHYENEPFLVEAIEMCREQGTLEHTRVIALSWWSVVTAELIKELFGDRFPGWHAEHAGLCETSLMLYLKPELVRPQRPVHDRPPREGIYLHPIDPSQIADRGVLARTEGSSADAGRRLFEHVCSGLQALVRHPDGMQLQDPED